MHRAIAMMRERNRSGRAATAKQLTSRNVANPGRFARKNTASRKTKLCPKLINCAISTGTTAMMPISRPSTMICQGYSKMLAPAVVASPRRQKSGAAWAWKSNVQNDPVTIRDHSRQVMENRAAASSHDRCTLL